MLALGGGGLTEAGKDGVGWGHVIRENKNATVVRPLLRPASNYTHRHKRTGASNLAIRLSLRCHMGTMCAG